MILRGLEAVGPVIGGDGVVGVDGEAVPVQHRRLGEEAIGLGRFGELEVLLGLVLDRR